MVIWTARAKKDLKSIHRYIAEDSPTNAKNVTNDMLIKVEPLADLPKRGKVVPEIGREDVREISVHTWRLIYHIRQQNVFIIAIAHKRQQLSAGDIPFNVHDVH
ncbi:MAG: type II toxin-antitoxin system RelE/ParE family toxin [Hahellaceae bacterium]|jgi:addiction module RelE/StbE family toxin|nr:type II toxin-antitoxin system RelE/ParE family toxin [Hahellaceae bacterium]MCP5212513.1 type II toxin-antitoxin system RelE/ParE family toxin [Hahellaceae bacterium]